MSLSLLTQTGCLDLGLVKQVRLGYINSYKTRKLNRHKPGIQDSSADLVFKDNFCKFSFLIFHFKINYNLDPDGKATLRRSFLNFQKALTIHNGILFLIKMLKVSVADECTADLTSLLIFPRSWKWRQLRRPRQD